MADIIAGPTTDTYTGRSTKRARMYILKPNGNEPLTTIFPLLVQKG
jgi:hypothetical protein